MAKILLSQAYFLVMDAPTNHLGLSSKQALAGYEGMLLLISYASSDGINSCLFQFHGDDVFKPIAVLLGGEKARISLA